MHVTGAIFAYEIANTVQRIRRRWMDRTCLNHSCFVRACFANKKLILLSSVISLRFPCEAIHYHSPCYLPLRRIASISHSREKNERYQVELLSTLQKERLVQINFIIMIIWLMSLKKCNLFNFHLLQVKNTEIQIHHTCIFAFLIVQPEMISRIEVDLMSMRRCRYHEYWIFLLFSISS